MNSITNQHEFETTLERWETLAKRLGPEREARIVSGLAGVPDDQPVLQAVILLLEGQIKLEHLAAKQPNISNDARNFNTGRESALEDFRAILAQLNIKAG